MLTLFYGPGACSMATGEYISVASQTELTQAEIEVEKTELRRVPKAEEAELAQVYVERGVEPALAREAADSNQPWILGHRDCIAASCGLYRPSLHDASAKRTPQCRKDRLGSYSPQVAKASLKARSPGAPFSIAMMARR